MIPIEIIQADITKLKVDAIVNAAAMANKIVRIARAMMTRGSDYEPNYNTESFS